MSTKSLQKETLGSLNLYYHLAPELGAGEADCAVAFLHGYGADASDLIPLKDILESKLSASTRNKLSWYFIEGTFQLEFGGRAWFPLTEKVLLQLANSGRIDNSSDSSVDIPAGFLESRQQLTEVFQELGRRHSELTTVGFSQGGMMSFHCGGLAQKIALLSTALLGEEHLNFKWSNQQFFQSHGVSDSVIPYHQGQTLHEYLKKIDKQALFHSFSGGHQIPEDVITELARFLD